MLSIRLSRVGKKKKPQYRIIVCEKARDPWGRAKEIIGHYDPCVDPKILEIQKDRLAYWVSKGAQCTETVWNLMVERGILEGEKRRKVKISLKKKEKLAKKQAETKKEVKPEVAEEKAPEAAA